MITTTDPTTAMKTGMTAPAAELERLSHDPDAFVRYGVVMNSAADEVLLRARLDDSSELVRTAAAARLRQLAR